jgi:hypothetical protein
MAKSDQDPTYKIVAAQEEGATSLDVQITWSDGRVERMIGFASEAAARDWIDQSRARKHGRAAERPSRPA